MKLRFGMTLLLIFTLMSHALASDEGPAATTKDTPAKAKAKPSRKKIPAAQAARSRAMLDAAIEAEGRRFMQAEANYQATIHAEQQRLQDQKAQQLDTVRRLNPRAVTVTKARPDGTYETVTYWVYPNTYPMVGVPTLP